MYEKLYHNLKPQSSDCVIHQQTLPVFTFLLIVCQFLQATQEIAA